MRIKSNANTEYLKQMLSDPAALATQVVGWRDTTGFTQAEAAYFLDLPVRTLQGIEQGRGFRYPLLLWQSMRHLDEEMEKVGKYTPEQMRAATADNAVAARKTKEMHRGNPS